MSADPTHNTTAKKEAALMFDPRGAPNIVRTLLFHGEEQTLEAVLFILAEQRGADSVEGQLLQGAGEDIEALQAEIARLRGWFHLVEESPSRGLDCAHQALSGFPLPTGCHGWR